MPDKLIDKIVIPEPDESQPFFIEDGKYYVKEKAGKADYKNVEQSNFTMSFVYHLVDGTNDTTRIILIERYSGERKLIEVKSSELKPDRFDVILKSHSCVFLGTNYKLKQLTAFLFDYEKEAIKFDNLGYNKKFDFYVFPDSILHENKIIKADENGIIQKDKQAFYLPAFSSTNVDNADYESERKCIYREGNLDFKEWASLIYDAHGGNGAIGIQFILLSLFRDIVFYEFGFFPYLFLFGPLGSGKTTFTRHFLSLFTKDTEGTPLNSTYKALSRILDQRVNSVFYFKEFNRKIGEEIANLLLTVYDGSNRSIGLATSDNKTKEFGVHSSIIFDGNALPDQKAAYFSRNILLNFQHSKFSKNQKKANDELNTESRKGFSQLIKEAYNYRGVFKRTLRKVYEEIYNRIKNNESLSSVEDRYISHASLLIASYQILSGYLKQPYSQEKLESHVIENISAQSQIQNSIKEISVFWKSLEEYQHELGSNQDTHSSYLLKSSDSIIYVKFNKVFPKYSEYCRRNNIEAESQSTLRSNLASEGNPAFIPPNQASQKEKNTKMHVVSRFGSAYAFKYTELSDNRISINGVEIQIKS